MSIRISMIILLFIISVGGQQLRSQSKANPGGFDLVDTDGEHSQAAKITAIITLRSEHS